MATYKKTLKTTKSSTPKKIDLSFVGPMLPKEEVAEKVESKKEVVENKEVAEKKRIINRPIFCYVNGQPYPSLCAALREHVISLDKKTSPWFKINRELKKHGEYQYESLRFSLSK